MIQRHGNHRLGSYDLMSAENCAHYYRRHHHRYLVVLLSRQFNTSYPWYSRCTSHAFKQPWVRFATLTSRCSFIRTAGLETRVQGLMRIYCIHTLEPDLTPALLGSQPWVSETVNWFAITYWLSSRPFGQYQVILLGDRGARVCELLAQSHQPVTSPSSLRSYITPPRDNAHLNSAVLSLSVL